MDLSALEAGLDAEQLRAVTTTASPVAVLAPAGSGKTRVLSRRVAHRIAREEIEPQHVLAVTFTRRAASELSVRLERLGLRNQLVAGTFHALALGQIRDHHRDHRLAAPKVLDRKRGILETATGRTDARQLAEIATEIEWAKARQITPDEYVDRATAARRRTRSRRPDVADAYQGYEAIKADRGLLDFDDLLLTAARLIENDPAFARAQRWRFRHLFVDEFQDINPLQFRLLEAWRGDRYDLFVVGDPQQAIYTWNGADPSFLLDIGTHYPPVQVIRLATNYRSTPQILDGATSVLATAGLTSDDVVPSQADGALPRLSVHADETEEARAIARLVRREQGPNMGWSSHAVLVRTNAQLAPIREAFRLARIPHEVRGADPVVDHPAIRKILAELDQDQRPVSAVIDDLQSMDVEADLRVRLDELESRALAFSRSGPGATAAELAAFIRTTADRRGESRRDAVTLATFHAAKGLEWPAVHLAGLEAGFVPIGHARTREARAEEARLLYVAMTRAERVLHLHAASSRTVGGRSVEREVSPLLRHLPTITPLRADADEQRSALGSARSALATTQHDDQSLTTAIMAWREVVARRARIPASSVLPDRVLRELVAHPPNNLESLSRIEGLGPIKAARFGDELLDVLTGRRGSP